MSSRDTVHLVDDTVRERRDAAYDRDDAGAELRMTAKAWPLTVEQLRDTVEALPPESYPH